MATSCNGNYLIELCFNILYVENHDESIDFELLAALEDCDIEELDDYTIAWCLNALNFLSINIAPTKERFIKIEHCKLKFLSKFIEENDYLKGMYINDVQPTEEKVLEEKEGCVIYDRYLPTRRNNFRLPEKGYESNLQIQTTNDEGKRYTAEVLIDSKGFVKEILKHIRLLDNQGAPTDYSEIYSNLLTDVLKYAEE